MSTPCCPLPAVHALRPVIAAALVLMGVLAGCSAAFDWRELPVSDARVLFPCKPDTVERPVALSTGSVPGRMLVCDAGGATWSLTVLPLGEGVAPAAVLDELRGRLQGNLQAASWQPLPAQPLQAGATGAVVQRMRAIGQRADGRSVGADVVLATRGAQVYQWAVLAPVDADASVRTAVAEFTDGWRWRR